MRTLIRTKSRYTSQAGRVLAGLAAGMLAGSSVLAGPLDKARVDGGARWVGHVDVEAAMGSTFSAFIREGYDARIRAIPEGHPARIPLASGIDLLRDIRGATFYGFELPSESVLVIEGTAAVDRLFEELEGTVMEFERIAGMGEPTYRWPDGELNRYAAVRHGSKTAERIVVMAGSKEHLARALQVLDGRVPSLAGVQESTLSESPRRGSVFFVAADGMNLAGGGARETAMLSRLTSTLVLDLGETGHEMYADIAMGAKNDREAEAMQTIINGMLAIAQVRVTYEPELQALAPMLAAVSVEKSGSRVRTKMSVDSEMVREFLSGLSMMDLACEEEAGSEIAPSAGELPRHGDRHGDGAGNR